MWIVAIAWIYVVGLMALTESSIVGGIMTFLAYCVVPLSIIYYIAGRGRRQGSGGASPARPAGAPAEAQVDQASANASDNSSANGSANGSADSCATSPASDSDN
jgi:hypothetical protein